MADCPYARCIQERKHIRRELLRWTKSMVFVVGLERVAEELMGRRRWKQYQDTLYTTRSSSSTNDNNNATSTPTSQQQQQQQQLQLQLQQLAQQVQQQASKPGELPLKAALTNHLQNTNASALTNCGSSGPVGAVGGERSPQRADEQNLTTTGGPENGERLVAAAAATCGGVTRENGSTENGPTNDEHHDHDREDHELNHHPHHHQPTRNNDTTTTKTTTTTNSATEEPLEDDEPEALRLKKELLEERIRLNSSPALDDRETNDQKTNDSEGTKIVKEEAGLDRIQAPTTQGLLRVKKEEDLQEPGLLSNCPRPTSTPNLAHNNNNSINSNNNNNGPSVELSRSASTPPKKEGGGIFCIPSYVLGRRPSPPPEDWKPLDKCYFCLDGKLPHDEQTHEEQPPLSPQSDNSSNSSRSAESPMSVQVDPMASVVAAALGGGFPTLLPQWCLPQRDQSHVAAVVAAAAAAAAQHQENQAGADQPLDLSAKPKNSQENNISLLEQKIPLRMSASLDPKTMYNSSCYRAKPRVAGAVTASGVAVSGGGGSGRRTYTEDELQAALRDIQSGKLGTRRAAVLYGIPRSTLRNKVYKLTMERERDATLSANAAAAAAAAAAANNTNNTTAHNSELAGAVVVGNSAAAANANTATSNISTTTITTTPNTTIRKNAAASLASAHTLLVDELNSRPLNFAKLEVDDKELSGAEEEKEVEKALQKPLISLEDLVRISSLEGSSAAGDSLRALLQRGQDNSTAEWSAFDHANIGPYIQKVIAAATPYKGRIGFGGMDTQDYRIPEVMRRLMSEDKKLTKEVNVNGDQSNQRAPMTNDDFNPAIEEEASDSGQGRPILKIPSYKPASSGTGTPGPSKNGAAEPGSFGSQGFPANASPALLERASPAFSGTSSPTNSLVGKGMAVNFRDVIAKSICVKFQEGQPTSGIPGQGVAASPMIVESNPYKRGRFTPPQQQSQQSGQTQQQSKSAAKAQDQQQQNKAAAGGKGTRPKRGKYRNYDRDSLVEAVRAVQRGEMSVHRAGSYYGVPHSTLEYKVKERHLMRPRKRDQKQADDKTKETTAVGSALRTPPAQGGTTGTTPEKKAAPMLKQQKPFGNSGTGAGGAATGNAATSAAATASGAGIPGPNGIKVPPFIDGMPHLPFAHPFNFWNPTFMPPGFIPPANVPAALLSEQYFASQRMRGLQEHQRNAIAQQRDGAATTAEQPGTSNARGTSLIKSENLYADSAAASNGSFLDNLIRSSLESGVPAAARSNASTAQQQSENLSNSKVLIDQLCRNSRRTPLPRAMQQDSSEDEAVAPTNYSTNSGAGGLPQRPERVPTVELSPSPRATGLSAGPDDAASDRVSPLSLSRHSGSGKEDDATSRSSREREVPNGGGSEKPEDRQDSTTTKKLNHYPDTQNLYAVSTDKKSACDSKLIVDHSSQKTQQHKVTAVIGAAGGGDDAHQLQQRGYANSASVDNNGRPATPNDHSPSPQPTTMEESVEQ